MMMILNLLCEYLAMVYSYSCVTWSPMDTDSLYIRCYNKADVDDIYLQIKLYCHDLQVTMDTVTCNEELFITLATVEKIAISCA